MTLLDEGLAPARSGDWHSAGVSRNRLEIGLDGSITQLYGDLQWQSPFLGHVFCGGLA